MFEEHGLWQEGIPPNYTLINASNPVWAHARRRASEEAAAVKRMEAARARGETCPRGIHETDMHALRAERHQRRMQSGGNWREEEQRRLAETVVVEGGTDIVTEAPCPHCVTWSGEVRPALSPDPRLNLHPTPAPPPSSPPPPPPTPPPLPGRVPAATEVPLLRLPVRPARHPHRVRRRGGRPLHLQGARWARYHGEPSPSPFTLNLHPHPNPNPNPQPQPLTRA